ncbi:F-box domain, Skp2-like protein [Cordyceps fumosorosea ARSEF 2679]|uniref:F-box domain, Skp2-like protein n=1 Tax=Cordyceps fumosorosea (strain ARSEF 2679) TaxID=1081104 RepID=A0A162MW21_CORFA|nr:F-box domain, Skp2-like protein [Cordyceps fumosorosea ARSEF 2679]OAA71479.1 F-box domain, Skp2-like protein [Cordyceps fumosorosea ARSEF 2679]
MSSIVYIAPCLLCGRTIFDSQIRNAPTWLNQFRILYSLHGEVFITGVGYYRDGSFDRWVAPPEYNDRWDDDGYNGPEDHRIGVLRQRPRYDRWGVPFHEACWSLLEVAMAPAPVPLERLLDICKSFPIRNCEFSPDWGHHYGGLDVEHPDDDRCVNVGKPNAIHHALCITRISKLDPFDLLDLERIRLASRRCVIWPGENLPPPRQQQQQQQKQQMMPGALVTRAAWTTRLSNDPFASLPEELRVAIAALLPTRDFLSLRLASPHFAPMFHQQVFWATRFAGFWTDRGWLFEARTWDRAATDWRRLWRLTSPAFRSSAMHNRARVWLLALNAKMLMTPRAAAILPSDDTLRLGTWRIAAAKVQRWNPAHPYMGFFDGCVSIRGSWPVALPPLIERVSFFFSWIGDAQYLAGLKVVGMCGTVVEFGYMGHEIPVPVSGGHLAGLCLALTEKGIKAVRCVFGDGSHSPWIGSLADTAQTSRLVSSGRLSVMTAKVDGCKIVSLSVLATDWPPMLLRNGSLWAKSIPDSSLQLNDTTVAISNFGVEYTSAPGYSAYSDWYDPIHRSVFGGTRGQSLTYLTGIHAYMLLGPSGLEFEFAPGHLDYVDTCEDLGVFPDSDCATMQHFYIDGPGGERITGVELYLEHEEGVAIDDSQDIDDNRDIDYNQDRDGIQDRDDTQDGDDTQDSDYTQDSDSSVESNHLRTLLDSFKASLRCYMQRLVGNLLTTSSGLYESRTVTSLSARARVQVSNYCDAGDRANPAGGDDYRILLYNCEIL